MSTRVVDDMGRKPTIQLSSGRLFCFEEPTALTIDEIAHALSHICRFTGNCRTFYSVLQHSLLVSYLVDPRYALWGLLHDAVEAVIGDMASPLKKLNPDYKVIENRCEAVILGAFGLHGDMPFEVKQADLIALRTEQRDLMPTNSTLWMSLTGVKPAARKVRPMPIWWVRLRFKWRFRELMRQQQHQTVAA
jgi:hypothetical protein